jgi:hypothetical protein
MGDLQSTILDNLKNLALVFVLVESATGRKVRAFLSQNHIDPAIAVEIFVLDAEGGDEASDVQADKA